MPRFRYTATDGNGRSQTGELDVRDQHELMTRLEAQGLEEIHVEEVVEPDEAPVDLKAGDFVELAHGIADVTGSGWSLGAGLKAMADESPSLRLRSALRKVAGRLDAGESLEEALTSQTKRFPPHLAALIRAGILSGQLDEVLRQSLSYSMRSDKLRRRVALNLGYPLGVVLIGGMLCLFLVAFVVPGFSQIFYDFQVQLPTATVALLSFGNFLHAYGLWVALMLMVMGIAAWTGAQYLFGQAFVRRVICCVPVFGTMLRNLALMEFSHLLGILLSSRIPLPEALRLAGGGNRDADLKEGAYRLADDVAGGGPFAWMAAATRQFPSIFAQFASWGERHHAQSDAMHAAGEVFENRANVQASLVSWLTEPFVLIFVGGSCTFVVVALFWPMFNLLNALS